MAGAYLVTAPAESGQTLKNGANGVVVWAENATQAKDLAKAALSNDGNDMWGSATATALVVGTELEGWTFGLRLDDPVTPFAGYTVTVVGTNGQVIDDIGTALATALNGLSEIANAAYNTGTNVLTISDATDALGDWHMTFLAYPPGASSGGSSGTFYDTTVNISGFAGAITAETTAANARTVTLVASAPVLYAAVKTKDIN